MRAFLLIGIGLALISNAWAGQTGFVSDVIEITVRTGPGMDRKIFTMVRSGQRLETLGTESDWTRIRLPSGREGWVLSRFVTTDPPVRFQFDQLEKKYNQLLAHAKAPVGEIGRLSAENEAQAQDLAEARQAVKALESKLAALAKDAASAPGIRAAYQRSSAELVRQRQRSAAMEKQLAQAEKSNTIHWFLAGGGVLFLGFVLGNLSRRKHRRSSLL
jgi:SH3 domain protein